MMIMMITLLERFELMIMVIFAQDGIQKMVTGDIMAKRTIMLKGTGWYLDKDDTWHYIYSDGTMATGERTIGGKKYWFTGYGDWIR